MNRLFFKRTALLAVVFMMLFFRVSSCFAAAFLDPDAAFKLKAELNGSRTIVLHWKIAKGYKLYRDKVTIGVESGKAPFKAPVLPKGIVFTDPTTGEKLDIYHDQLHVELPLVKSGAPFTLTVEYQGCAEDGLCYPPITKSFKVDPAIPGVLSKGGNKAEAPAQTSATPASSEQQLAAQSPASATASVASPAPATTSAGNTAQAKKSAPDDLNLAQSTLAGGSLWKVAFTFLGLGLLLAFTPCVLPMIPILSSIIVGEGNVSKSRSFLMAVAYCLGMALVYTSLGVAAGLAGEGLAGALQKPWVLVLFALLLVGLSLSMFDLYQLQLPLSVQNKLTKTSGKLKGGSFVGVFVMGALSALIVGPCVAAPLAGTLVFISKTHNVVLGGLALFSMAMGMSVPLLLVGLSAGSLLPKAGAWMIGVKYVFGLMLIAVAVWMVSPVLPAAAVLLAWGAYAILCAVFLGVFGSSTAKLTIGQRFGKTFGIVLLVIGVLELVGAASGGTSALEPLAGLHSASSAGSTEEKAVSFTRIKTVAELDQALLSAKKPVMLDFYADWCVSCKELDRFTFHDPKVMAQLQNLTLLQVDVTANSDADKVLMKRFGLFGPPGMIFFDAAGKEIPDGKIVGVPDAEAFYNKVAQYLKTP